MDRRNAVIGLTCLGAAAALRAAIAQPRKTPKIGVLTFDPATEIFRREFGRGLRVEEIGLPQSGKERRIGELAPPDTDYVVLALRRDGRWEFNPGAELRAKPGSTLIVMTTPAGRAKLERLVAA